MARLLITLTIALLLTACASQRAGDADPQPANEVMFSAMAQVGTPYRYGGSSPQTGFDCSGLIGYVYRESVGVVLPRTVKEMSELPAPDVDRDDLQTGDLLFFDTSGTRTADHAGIYVGKGRFVHAPSRGSHVRLDTLDDDYWARCFVTGKRPLVH